ncbi:isopenicillin N synthase family dioxygenase [Candidatus Poriferisodalis sp.]|uniref:isopenicillin N synthase family dioxygenase n=1 Tax=Candidatus Poriferisodalis sp. TaxID=3101277 RepID=UPI003B01258A
MAGGCSASIPVINISPNAPLDDASAQIDAACRDIGFFAITGHGVHGELLESVLGMAREFFAQPLAYKNSLAIELSDHHRGYAGIEGELLEPGLRADCKETMDFGPEVPADDLLRSPLEVPNQWPDIAGFRDAVEGYQAAVLKTAKRLMCLIAQALGQEMSFFDQRFERPLVGTRLIRYPAVAEPLPDQLGCGAHSDYGCVTLLHTDGAQGMQLADVGGSWHDVVAPPGSFIVNLGDMLARWSNDRYRATVHRVQSPRTADRYSVPTFVNPSYDTVVECLSSCLGEGEQPKYPATTSGACLQSRFDETFAYRQ